MAKSARRIIAKVTPRKKPVRRPTLEASLANDYLCIRSQLRNAAKILHDEAGSSLAAAGLQLQLLRMDYPQAEQALAELVQSLEGAMQTVRQLMLDLSPSPVRALGLKTAMEDLAAQYAEAWKAQVTTRFNVKSSIPADVGDSLYYLTELILRELPVPSGATYISITGKIQLLLRIRIPEVLLKKSLFLKKVALLSESCGLAFAIDAGKVTIISVRYALRRSAG